MGTALIPQGTDGALAGTLVPTTRREQEAVAQVQPALESAAQELGAQVVAEAAKDHVTEAAQQLKDHAQDAAESVKAEASAATIQPTGDVTASDAPRRA